MRDATIEDYRWLYAHGYMPDGLKCAEGIMLDIMKRCPGTFMDFGCGRGDLVSLLNHGARAFAFGYDPASSVAGISHPLTLSSRVDWAISCDVLEHIAPEQIDDTLRLFDRVARKGLLLTIANMNDVHMVKGEEVQLHLIRKEMGWWTEKTRQHFPSAKITGRPITCNGDRFAVIVDF